MNAPGESGFVQSRVSSSEPSALSTDSDREEGELSDASMEMDSPVLSPQASRKRRGGLYSPDGSRKLQRTAEARGVLGSHDGAHKQATLVTDFDQERRHAMSFILALHDEGFAFKEILEEFANEALLRNIYTELGVAITDNAPPVVSAVVPVEKYAEQTQPVKTRSETIVAKRTSPTVTSTTNAKAAPSKTVAVPDRSEYLARLSQLRAAKMAKAADDKLTIASSLPIPATDGPADKGDPQPAPPSSQTTSAGAKDAEKQNKITELVKRKMELLKAEQKKREDEAAARAAALISTPLVLQTKEPVNGTQGSPDAVVVPSKKRPVASDFLDASETASKPAFTRPFGQSHENSEEDPFIIEASEDETADADDELGDDTMDSDERVLQDNSRTTSRDQRLQDFPPLSDFPPRGVFNKSTGTPTVRTPAVQTPGPASDPEALKKQEQEIAALKLRIMEAQQKRKAAASKVNVANAPRSAAALPALDGATSPIAESRPEAALTTIEASGPQGSEPLVPSQAVTNDTKAGRSLDYEKKAQLEAKLTARSAAVEAKKARMAEMQRQLLQMQEEYEEEMLAQEQLRNELQVFDVNTDGMSKAEMEAKKEEIVQQIGEAQMNQVSMAVDNVTREAEATNVLVDLPIATEGAQGEVVDGEAIFESAANSYEPEASGSISIRSEQQVQSAVQPTSSMQDEASPRVSHIDVEVDDVGGPASRHAAPTDQTVDNAETADIAGNAEESEDMDMDESSVESSEPSESESSSESDDGSEATSPQQVIDRASPIFDGPEDEVDVPMDVSSEEPSQTVEQAKTESDSSEFPSVVVSSVNSPLQNVSNDTAPELRIISQVEPEATRAQEFRDRKYFTPYKTPLEMFKKYRFHPDYVGNIQGGYRSQTYSHNIKAMDMLCPFEGSGGTCNDAACQYQHFHQMTIPDHEILVQLYTNAGTAGQSHKENERFKDGLRRIVQELRQSGTQDTEEVAGRIARYRREFLDDPSKILGL